MCLTDRRDTLSLRLLHLFRLNVLHLYITITIIWYNCGKQTKPSLGGLSAKINSECSLSPLGVGLLIDEPFSGFVPTHSEKKTVYTAFYTKIHQVGCGRKPAGVLFSVKPEESAVLPEQTELKHSEFLLAADGGGNEKLMGKITSNMFILSIKAKKKNLLD